MCLEALIEPLGVNEITDVRKSLGGWDAVRKLDLFLPPSCSVFAEIFDFNEVIHPPKSRGHSHKKNFPKMGFSVVTSVRVFENLKGFKPVRKPVGVVNFICIARRRLGWSYRMRCRRLISYYMRHEP